MKRFFLTAVLTAVCAAFASAQGVEKTDSKDAALLAEARAFEKELVEVLRRGDRATLERMIGDGFVFIHSTGPVETRDEHIKNAGGGNLLLQRTEFENFDEAWRVYEGTTVVRYRRTVMRNRAANTENRLRNVNVYVKTAARGWQWVSGQSTRLPVRPKAAAIDAKAIENLTGVYRIDAGRTFTVTTENGALYGTTTGRLKAELVPVLETVFVLFNENNDAGHMTAAFTRDAVGAAEVVLHLNGQEVWRAKKSQ